MKVVIDGVTIIDWNEIEEGIVKNEIQHDIFEADMIRRLKWKFERNILQAYDVMKKEWDPKLEAAGVESVPTDPVEYAKLVFSQPSYQSK